MLTGETFEMTYIHLLFVLELMKNPSLDIKKQALLMVSDVALTWPDEVMLLTMADGALLTELVFDIEVDS